MVEQESAVALPRLAAEGLQARLIFVGGQHRFDNVLVILLLADAICTLDGAIVFDDACLPSIQKVVRLIRNNRSDYRYTTTGVQTAAVFWQGWPR